LREKYKATLVDLLVTWVRRFEKSYGRSSLTFMLLALDSTPQGPQLPSSPENDLHSRSALRSRCHCEYYYSCVGSPCPRQLRREGGWLNQGGRMASFGNHILAYRPRPLMGGASRGRCGSLYPASSSHHGTVSSCNHRRPLYELRHTRHGVP
jgi:hypothetical protein